MTFDSYHLLVIASSALLFACPAADDSGADEVGSETGTTSSDTTGSDTTGSDTTGGDTTGGDTTGGDTTGGDTTGSDTGDPDPVVSTFTCVNLGAVEPFLQLHITGGFTAASEPRNLDATHVLGGATEFSVALPLLVDPNDPNYADVVAWESTLSMVGWDVNYPDDGSEDRRYFFIPSGAEGISTFDAFYYRVYGAGGSGQFDFECTRD